MSIVKAETFRSQSADELKAKLIELKKEQFNLRFKVASGEWITLLECALCGARLRALRQFLARC